jgi:hypothetical protein
VSVKRPHARKCFRHATRATTALKTCQCFTTGGTLLQVEAKVGGEIFLKGAAVLLEGGVSGVQQASAHRVEVSRYSLYLLYWYKSTHTDAESLC